MKETYQKIELPENFDKERKTSKKTLKPKSEQEEQSEDEVETRLIRHSQELKRA